LDIVPTDDSLLEESSAGGGVVPAAMMPDVAMVMDLALTSDGAMMVHAIVLPDLATPAIKPASGMTAAVYDVLVALQSTGHGGPSSESSLIVPDEDLSLGLCGAKHSLFPSSSIVRPQMRCKILKQPTQMLSKSRIRDLPTHMSHEHQTPLSLLGES
jgi:hypothetical protein